MARMYAFVLILTVTTTMTEATGLSEAQRDAVVAKHNELRASLGASDMIKLTWDQTLADAAQAHSGKCPGSKHSTTANTVGENMAQSGTSDFELTSTTDLTGSVQSWFDEKSKAGPYQKGGLYKGNSPCTGVCGHYTQVAWQADNHIGCGVMECVNQFGKGWKGYHLTCQYGTTVPGSFGGNMNDGKSVVFTQGTACSACPSGFETCSAGLCSIAQAAATTAAPSATTAAPSATTAAPSATTAAPAATTAAPSATTAAPAATTAAPATKAPTTTALATKRRAVSTSLKKGVGPGDTVLDVVSTADFFVGDEIIIDEGLAVEETHTIKAFSSIHTKSPLQSPHAAGASVQLKAATTTKPQAASTAAVPITTVTTTPAAPFTPAPFTTTTPAPSTTTTTTVTEGSPCTTAAPAPCTTAAPAPCTTAAPAPCTTAAPIASPCTTAAAALASPCDTMPMTPALPASPCDTMPFDVQGNLSPRLFEGKDTKHGEAQAFTLSKAGLLVMGFACVAALAVGVRSMKRRSSTQPQTYTLMGMTPTDLEEAEALEVECDEQEQPLMA